MGNRASRSSDVDIDREPPPRAPRWVWVSGIVAAVAVLVIAAVLLIGGHGGGRHGGGGDRAPADQPSGVDHDHLDEGDQQQLRELFEDLHG